MPRLTEQVVVNARDHSTGGRARSAERRIQALELRKEGASYRTIAARLGVSVAQAHGDVACSMSLLAELEVRQAEDARRLALERLDGLLVGHYERATNGDHKSALIVLKVIERQSKMLGLDATESQEVERSDVALYLQFKYGVDVAKTSGRHAERAS